MESEIARADELLEQHCYLGSLKAVGERLYYSISDENGDWLAVMVFTAAARRLRHRDNWIGWTDEQRRRRLSLVANSARFLLLLERTVPNSWFGGAQAHQRPAERRLAGALRPSGNGVGNFRRSRAL